MIQGSVQKSVVGSIVSRLLFAGLLVAMVTIISLMSASIGLDTAKADGLPVIQKTGTLTSNETWTPDSVYLLVGAVIVPDGVTLTIDQGTIVKVGGPSWKNRSIAVVGGGTLNVSGSTSNPVIFTSYKDDGVGGDSNGDGISSGANGDYGTAVSASGGTINISYSEMRYGVIGLSAQTSGCQSAPANITLSDNVFKSKLDLWDCRQGVLSMQRNHFEVPADTYPINIYNIDASIIQLSGLDKNTFAGVDEQVTLRLNGTTTKIPPGSSWTVDPGSGIRALLISNNLLVQGTLTMNPGTVAKYGPGSPSRSIVVASGGTLFANGTSNDPIIFTSQKDDSAGGDSTGDGPTSGAAGDYGTAVTASGGVVNISNSEMRFGNIGVSAAYYGCQSSPASVSLTDNNFKSPVWLIDCKQDVLTLKRNHFEVPAGKYPLEIQNVDVSAIQLSGADKNTFTGNDKQVTLRLGGSGTKVPAGHSWTVDFASGITSLLLNNKLTVEGELVINPGTVVKFGTTWKNYPIAVYPGGVLSANGSSTSPIIFTSAKDDSVGGDSEGDGLTSGTAEDYSTAISVSDGSVDISHAEIRFGNYGINSSNASIVNLQDVLIEQALWINDGQFTADNVQVSDPNTAIAMYGGQANISGSTVVDAAIGLDVRYGAQVVFRGTFNNISQKAIQACDWDEDCGVDAAYVDWGSVDGPFPSGGNPLVCGKVTTSPWVYEADNYSDSLFASQNCDSSSGPGNILGSNISYFQGRMALKQVDCDNGYQDACDSMTTAMACLSGAMTVAQSTAPWQLPPAGSGQEIDAFSAVAIEGASSYISSLEEVSVPQFNLGFFTQLSQVIDTTLQLGGAYSSCSP